MSGQSNQGSKRMSGVAAAPIDAAVLAPIAASASLSDISQRSDRCFSRFSNTHSSGRADRPAALASELADAEYEALLDAERLETAAEVERSAADLDEVMAETAREEADRLRRERS
jgi:hypothetical protein